MLIGALSAESKQPENQKVRAGVALRDLVQFPSPSHLQIGKSRPKNKRDCPESHRGRAKTELGFPDLGPVSFTSLTMPHTPRSST